MAVYTWATEKSNFVCSLNDPPITIALQIQEEIQQGMRFKIKNFDPVKAYAAFLALASVLRNKSTIGTLPSYGALEGNAIITPTCPNRWGL